MDSRALTTPTCKWDEVINVDADCENTEASVELPDIVIMTHAFFMNLKDTNIDNEASAGFYSKKHAVKCRERDTESRYHSVVSYITYLLKRPFFSVLGLVPI